MPERSFSEEALLEACRKGDRSMQFEFYSRFARKMMGVCRRYTASKMEAEDQLQESFVLVFKNINQYQGGSLEGWIRRIVVNQCIGHFHKQKRKNFWMGELTENMKEEIEDTSWVNQVDAEQLMNWIDALPHGSKTVFNLAAIEGYSHQEIANMLNIGESASRSQLTRARQALQKKFYQQTNTTS
jgi:RNA polymerase sigma factor (sigma-70 family)